MIKKDFKHIDGGFVYQDADKVGEDEVKNAKLVSKVAAEAQDMKDLEIAYKVASLTKSNCVVYVKKLCDGRSWYGYDFSCRCFLNVRLKKS